MATLFRVKALFEYSSPHEDDLTFDAGQVISVTEQDDDDWYGGEYVDANGAKQEGIFPRNFVEKIEPAAPPRPSRPRPKKADATEAEQDPEPAPQRAASPPPPPPPAEPVPEPEPEPEPIEEEGKEEEEEEQGPLSPVQSRISAAPPRAPARAPAAEPIPESSAESQRAPSQAPPPAAATKPKAAAPPPVKPKSNAFKDRIAAFNKADAAPIIPFKPGGTGTDSFVKKPFVPPPPSRHAYVPPPATKEPPQISAGYRREEDPEIQQQENENLEQAEKAGLLPGDMPQADDAEEDDQPKPTSLKERIALLQKQQLEQAQRHAEAAAKKDKAKKPPAPKKRVDPPPPPPAGAAEAEEDEAEAAPLQRTDTETTVGRGSVDEPLRSPPPPRRKPSKGPAVESPHDGNEADMSGAGDTTEGQDDASDRDEAEEAAPAHIARVPTSSSTTQRHAAEEQTGAADEEEEEEEEEEEQDEVDPEIRRKEELRARMAKMSGGMGFHGMFGAAPPIPPVSAPKKKTSKTEHPAISQAEEGESTTSRAAPPVPTPMALPGMGLGIGAGKTRDEEEDEGEEVAEEAQPRALPTRPPPPPARPAPAEEDEDDENEEEVPTPHATDSTRQVPPVPPGRPVPPPVPSEARPPPPPPPADKSNTEGSQSDDELSSSQRENRQSMASAAAARSPTLPPAPTQPLQSPRSPPLSPRGDESSKKNNRPPPPIPGSVAPPPPPPPAASRPPPPPPPGELSRSSTADTAQAPPPIPSSGPPPLAGEDADAEVTEYEGDYDTDIASSVPHRDALKAHAREPSADDTLHSPETPGVPPPLPPQSPPRAAPPPLPNQPPPQPKRTSVDAPRAAPPPPPPVAEEPAVAADTSRGQARKTPRIEEEAYFTGASPSAPQSPGFDRRLPPTTPGGTRHVSRQSTDGQRMSTSRLSTDIHRPSLDSGFIANDIDLAVQSGWWKQANQLPPYFQGRRDIYFETTESTTTNQGAKTVITREIFVLYQDYSQTIITVHFDPYEPSDVQMDQRHDPPPRPLRQDEMEEFYDRFGRQIAETITSKKDSVVGDGTPQGLVHELLRPLNGALAPIGTRSFGALVYSNMANASTQQNDIIRPGDIMSIRNGKFQGKHGPMHAKYSAEVGKPDHIAVVAEWDGTKKKVRAWEQGRENKKVKVESYKLDDLRSGEVKIWRVVPRSWVGWNSQP